MCRYNALLSGALVAVLALSSCASGSTGSADDKQVLYIGDDIAVAQTIYGKVRGFILRDIYQFRGIPYAASTEGKNRFMPPQQLEPWEGVLPTLNYGESAPQVVSYSRAVDAAGFFVDHWNYDTFGEDCLRLNVWTPGLADGKKRPVLVWFHGGGYSSGNGIEQDGYNGENLARRGDIVFVSVNHRLNSFGFSDFAKVGGEKYALSGNVGVLDLCASLRWVHDNIESFGGDPSNVTIMGQSGGGSKVSTVASMTSAKGMVHKAVALSGNSIKGSDKATAEALGEYIVKYAGLKPSEIDKLQEMPWEEYYKLANEASRAFAKETGLRAGFSPVGDGLMLPEGTFYDPTDPTIPDVPMLYCTVMQESNPNRDDASMESMTMEEAVTRLQARYGDKAQEIVDEFLKVWPDYRPIEVFATLSSNRSNVVRAANTKVGQKSPVYMALFGWQPPLFDNRLRAFHCLDISFWFNNTDEMYTHTGGGACPRNLSDKMSDALIAFMKTGNPNCKALPEWPEYTPEVGALMYFDNECKVMNDPDRAYRSIIENR